MDYSNKHNVHHFSHFAMATVFDFYLLHESKNYAQQAIWEAIKDLERLENEFSRFLPNSDVSRINNASIGEKLILSMDTFSCLEKSIELNKKTFGAFNVACGSLLHCWLNKDYSLKSPSENEISGALKKSNIENIVLNKNDFSVELNCEGMIIDFGAIGKGFVIDLIAETLSDWQINDFLLSAGKSSLKSSGKGSEALDWEVSFSNPQKNDELLGTIGLSNSALGASGLRKGNHIINPLTGRPENKSVSSWVICNSALEADAYSTAFMILDNEQIENICSSHKDLSALVIRNTIDAENTIHLFGDFNSYLKTA